MDINVPKGPHLYVTLPDFTQAFGDGFKRYFDEHRMARRIMANRLVQITGGQGDLATNYDVYTKITSGDKVKKTSASLTEEGIRQLQEKTKSLDAHARGKLFAEEVTSTIIKNLKFPRPFKWIAGILSFVLLPLLVIASFFRKKPDAVAN